MATGRTATDNGKETPVDAPPASLATPSAADPQRPARGGILNRFGKRVECIGRRLALHDRPRQVWIDVGAHHGEETLAAAEANPAITVFAFEPNLDAAALLMGHLPNYVVVPMAVAEEDGSSEFHVNAFEQASSLLPFDPDALSRWVGEEKLEKETIIRVPTIRLDTFLNRARIAKVDFLKIDVQGADLAALKSAGNRLRDVRKLVVEVPATPRPLYRGGGTKQEVLDFLTVAGFVLISQERQSHDQEENLTFLRAAERENK